jgi:hypothetical protein
VQLGGSIASAVAITIFDRRTAFHSDILGAAVTLKHVQLAGSTPTGDTLARLAALVTQEASTLGFGDTILAAALVAPLVLAFPRARPAA